MSHHLLEYLYPLSILHRESNRSEWGNIGLPWQWWPHRRVLPGLWQGEQHGQSLATLPSTSRSHSAVNQFLLQDFLMKILYLHSVEVNMNGVKVINNFIIMYIFITSMDFKWFIIKDPGNLKPLKMFMQLQIWSEMFWLICKIKIPTTIFRKNCPLSIPMTV